LWIRFLIHTIGNPIDKELAEIVGKSMEGPGLTPSDIGNLVSVIWMPLEIKISLFILKMSDHPFGYFIG
jgi:hypothetical protein